MSSSSTNANGRRWRHSPTAHSIIKYLHNPVNVHQTPSKHRAGSSIITYSSKRRAISTCILNTFAGSLLEICWTYAGSCKRGITAECWHGLSTRCWCVISVHQRTTLKYTINVKYATDFQWFCGDFLSQCMRYPVKIHCCKWPNYDFCISQGSVATVFRCGRLN